MSGRKQTRIGQVKTDEKSNEITAIPKLLKILDILYWQLDMSFREDESRMRKGHSVENFAVIRHVVLNLLKRDKSFKLGVKTRRLRAGWDDKYLTNPSFQLKSVLPYKNI